MTNDNGEGDKALDVGAMTRSVIDVLPAPSPRYPTSMQGPDTQVLWFVGNYADEVPNWGGVWRQRDALLRAFITKEPFFASALNIMCARNAGFSWTLDGPPRTVAKALEILENANMGEGWDDLIVKTSIDLYTQDNGAFWELVREENNERAPVIGINHLDAAQCQHTGNPSTPVIYTDRLGKPHALKWWNVITMAEMPTPKESMRGMQYCALSRMLTGAKIQRNLMILENEKVSGRETRAIHLVQGITTQQLNDAIKDAQAKADGAGLLRYAAPVVVGTIDPTATVKHDTIELASLKEGYDEKLNFEHYMNLIAMAFASDYQEFAPLPGGGLGTGAQSEMLHLKNRGKGPERFRKLISHAINLRIAPQNIKFIWTEQDLEAQKMEAEVRAIRAQTRATRIASFEISPDIARQLANDEGDLEEEYLIALDGYDISDTMRMSDSDQPSTADLRAPRTVPRPDPNRFAARNPNPTAARPRQTQQNPTA